MTCVIRSDGWWRFACGDVLLQTCWDSKLVSYLCRWYQRQPAHSCPPNVFPWLRCWLFLVIFFVLITFLFCLLVIFFVQVGGEVESGSEENVDRWYHWLRFEVWGWGEGGNWGQNLRVPPPSPSFPSSPSLACSAAVTSSWEISWTTTQKSHTGNAFIKLVETITHSLTDRGHLELRSLFGFIFQGGSMAYPIVVALYIGNDRGRC